MWFEHVEGLEPCNLCIFQRVAIMALGLVLLIAGIHGPTGFGRRLYAGICLIIAVVGGAIASRQLWLQAQPEPDTPPDCGAGLEFMLEAFPIKKVVELVLTGSGDCSEVHKVFGLSIPLWTLIVFAVFALISLYYLFSKNERRTFNKR